MNNDYGDCYCPDASAFITAWDHSYPKDIFPSLWGELAKKREHMIWIEPIFEEIHPPSGLYSWLVDNSFKRIPVDDIEEQSLQLELKYTIEKNSARCASKNDIRLINYAKNQNKIVVTSEKRQQKKPDDRCNYRIPAICEAEGVECITFIDMVKKLGIKI